MGAIQRMKIGTLTALLFFASHIHAAQAQESNTDDKVSRVEISTKRDPELRSYSQLLRGMKAYIEKRQLAPNSELYFLILPRSNGVSVQNLTLRLVSDDNSINIPIDANGKFKLPVFEIKTDDEYELILNASKGQFRILEDVKSANLPDDVKRLGDLRLECEARWASKRDVSPVFNIYVKLLASGNPCTSRTVNVGFFVKRDVASIILDTPKSKITLKVRPYESYNLPIWDAEISDDVLIKYESTTAGPSKQE